LRKSLLFAAIFVAFSSLCGNANASGHIYLLKGLAGIFSTGLDVLDQKLIQQGYSATVHSYLSYEELAAEAARLQKSGKGPIIIMGHSSGADAAISMTDIMKTLGAPVALVVTFGPTTNLVAPSNVSQVINYYFGTIPVASGPEFRGTISNVDLSGDADINHLNVEKIDRLHAIVIAKVQALLGHGGATRITGQGRASPAAAVQYAKLGDQTAMMQ
jgi:hypothetical protein